MHIHTSVHLLLVYAKTESAQSLYLPSRIFFHARWDKFGAGCRGRGRGGGGGHLESELLAGPQVIYAIRDDVMYADTDVAEGQQILLTQLPVLLQQVVMLLKVQHSLHTCMLHQIAYLQDTTGYDAIAYTSNVVDNMLLRGHACFSLFEHLLPVGFSQCRVDLLVGRWLPAAHPKLNRPCSNGPGNALCKLYTQHACQHTAGHSRVFAPAAQIPLGLTCPLC